MINDWKIFKLYILLYVLLFYLSIMMIKILNSECDDDNDVGGSSNSISKFNTSGRK